MKAILALSVALVSFAQADIGFISPADAKKLIEDPSPAKRPIVLDTGEATRTTSADMSRPPII
jgi:hypothetical protein